MSGIDIRRSSRRSSNYGGNGPLQRVINPVSILRSRSQAREPTVHDDFASMPVVAARSRSRSQRRMDEFETRQRDAYLSHQSAHAERIQNAAANRDFETINREIRREPRNIQARQQATVRERDVLRRARVARVRQDYESNAASVIQQEDLREVNEALAAMPQEPMIMMRADDVAGSRAHRSRVRRAAAEVRAEHAGQLNADNQIINVRPYDEEKGGAQSCTIEVTIIGFYIVMHGSDVYHRTESRFTETHIFHLPAYRSQEELMDSINHAIGLLTIIIAEGSKDSGYKVFYAILTTVTGMYSAEEIRAVAHNPTEVRLHASIPIQYGFLKRMGVDVTLAEKQEKKGLNCFTSAVLSHIRKHDIMIRMKLTEIKIAEEMLNGRELAKGETLSSRGYSINDGIEFFDRHEAFNVYAFDQLGNVIWKSEYNKDQKRRLAPPLMFVAHNAHVYVITDDKIRTSLIHRIQATTQGLKTNLFSDDGKVAARAAKEEQLITSLARKRYDNFEWNEKEPLNLKKLNTYKDCNLFMDKKCLHNMLIELYRQQSYVHTGEYFSDRFSKINYFNNVTIFANPNTTPSLVKKEISLTGSSGTTVEVCRRLNVTFKNQSIGAATGHFADRYFNPLGAKTVRKAVTPKQRAAHILRFKNICQICKNDAGKKAEIDHIIRREAGGKDDDSNLQLLCKSCHDSKTRQEVNIFKLDRTLSHYNTATVQIFSQAKNAFIHTFIPLEEFGAVDMVPCVLDASTNVTRAQFRVKEGVLLAGLDMEKCRTNILRFGMGDNEFADFTVLDDPVAFDLEDDMHTKIPVGEYYIHTKNICPAKGNGWVTHVEVRYMLEEKLIKLEQIKWIVRASLSHPGDYYSKMIESVLEKLIISEPGSVAYKKEVHIAKSCINQFVGTWGTRTNDSKSISIYNSLEAAATDSHLRKEGQSSVKIASSQKRNNDAVRANQTVNIIPRTFDHRAGLDDEKKKTEHFDYVEMVYRSTRIKHESHVPIFRTVLGQEAVHLHKTMRILEKFGGVVVNCNTDNAIAMFRDREVRDAQGKKVIETAQQQIDAMWEYSQKICWDDAKTIKKYKRADMPSPSSLTREEEASEEEFKYTIPRYRVVKDPGFTNQEECRLYAKTIVKKLLNPAVDYSLQIDALAGCGKTTLVNHIIDILKEKDISHLALAPTHIASRLLGDDGKTMQSALSVLKHGNYKALSCYSVLILDEKSMVSELYWNALCMLKKNTNIRFVVVGNWTQLSPVADRSASFDYENSSAIHELCSGNMLRLTTCRRSDKLLFKQYKDMSALDVSKFGSDEHPIAICYYNSTVHAVNTRWMTHYKKKQKKHMIVEASEKAKKLLKCQDIILYDGLPLMACVTRESEELYNSERWMVRSWDKDEVVLKSDCEGETERRELIVNTDDLACMFRPAYAYTSHRAQGSSVRQPYSIYNWGAMSDRARYVAVSRGTRLSDVHIMRDADGEFM